MDVKDSAAEARILAASAEIFAEEGFAGARVDEIARRARVNKAMLYYHVGDKAALYTAVLTRNFDRVIAAIDAARAAGGAPEEALRRVIGAIVETAAEMPEHPRIMLREVASGGVHLPPAVVERAVQVLATIGELLAQGVRDGRLRPVNPVLTHLMVLGSIVFMTATQPMRGRVREAGVPVDAPDSPAELANFITDVLLNGIAARPEGGSR